MSEAAEQARATAFRAELRERLAYRRRRKAQLAGDPEARRQLAADFAPLDPNNATGEVR